MRTVGPLFTPWNRKNRYSALSMPPVGSFTVSSANRRAEARKSPTNSADEANLLPLILMRLVRAKEMRDEMPGLGQSGRWLWLELGSRQFDGLAAANRPDRGPMLGLMWTC